MLTLELRRRADDSLVPINVAPLAMQVRGEFSYPHGDEAGASRLRRSVENDRGPALVVRCADVNDVSYCIDFALRHDLRIALHNDRGDPASWADCDRGIAVDMRGLH